MPTLEVELVIRKVRPLRQKGLTAQEIAKDLGKSVHQVNYAIRLLLARGDIAPRPIGFRSARKQSGQDETIVRLRKASVSNRRIAAITGLTLHAVNRRIKVLKQRGLVEDRALGRTAMPARMTLRFWKNPQDPAFVTFVTAVQSGVANNELGRRHGCTGTRIAQIKIEMIKRYGPTVFDQSHHATTAALAQIPA